MGYHRTIVYLSLVSDLIVVIYIVILQIAEIRDWWSILLTYHLAPIDPVEEGIIFDLLLRLGA
jgi:hypothetical protein